MGIRVSAQSRAVQCVIQCHVYSKKTRIENLKKRQSVTIRKRRS
jgi:hypothetical protein